MKHEKTFEAIEKLKEIEVELHRLKNALEMANKALDAQRPWVGLTDEERKVVRDSVAYNMMAMTVAEWTQAVQHATEAKLKEKNHG